MMKEDQHTEFKRNWRDDFLKELAAFANSQGGTLYIGVDDDGTIAGVKDAKSLLQDLPNKIKNNLGFLADVDLQTEDGKEYIAISVKPQEEAISHNGKYYVRSGSTVQELRGQELASFLFSRMKIQWDSLPHPRATINDLDPKKIRAFVSMAREKRRYAMEYDEGNIHAILNSLRLLTDDDKVTNAALLLFAKDPQKWFLTSMVKCAQFYSTIVEKPIMSQHIYEGNVFELVEQAVSFVASRIDARVGERNKSAQVDVHYELPLQAVTEAIVNAIVHRDYLSNASVQVMLFRDRLEVWNPGRLPHGMSIEQLSGEHQSKPTNPALAYPVYLAGYIEQLGTGTNDLIKRCVDKGLRRPEFRQDDSFVTILWRPTKDASDQSSDQVSGHVTGQETGQVTGQAGSKLAVSWQQVGSKLAARHNISMSQMAQQMLKYVTPYTAKDICHDFGFKDVYKFRRDYINPLVDGGVLSMTNPDKPTSSSQKYVLTAEGIKMLNDNK